MNTLKVPEATYFNLPPCIVHVSAPAVYLGVECHGMNLVQLQFRLGEAGDRAPIHPGYGSC